MRLLPLLALVPLVSAQYFSAGWQPGQPDHGTQHPAPAYTPGAEQPQDSAPSAPPQPRSLSELFSINTLLTLAPVVSVFERFGINITERVALTQANLWDERILLITDDNFQELIVREPLTEEEEKTRVWATVISVTAAKHDSISKYMDQVFDSAFNETLHANDLPNVRWGRINYLDVTYLTTKWNVWQAPYLVIMTDRGSSLRFYKPHQLRMRDYALREFLQTEGWKATPAWESRYAPGGDLEWVMDIFAIYLTKVYNIVVLIPRWILYILSGVIGSVILNFLHRPKKQPAITKRETGANAQQVPPAKPAPSTPAPAPASTPAPAVKVKSESVDKPAASTTATPTPQVAPRRAPKRGKGKKQQA